MILIQSKILNQIPFIKFRMSTKNGLKREAPFYFNISKSVGDAEEIVERNRTELFKEFRVEPINVKMQNQVHGEKILIVDEKTRPEESDATITNIPGIALSITTADCPAIFLVDVRKRVIAAVHSGWRGTEKEILRKTIFMMVKNFQSAPSNIYAYIAPSITKKSYEVGKKVAEKFNRKFVSKSEEKYFLDLQAVNLAMLVTAGVPYSNIQVSKICSYQTKDLLHSYRRDGKNSGRGFGLLMLRKMPNE